MRTEPKEPAANVIRIELTQDQKNGLIMAIGMAIGMCSIPVPEGQKLSPYAKLLMGIAQKLGVTYEN